MAESAELKIVVRAVDATKSVLAGIGGRIVSVLLKPLGLVTNAVRGIVKQFFSLKSLLLGGGIIGVISALTDGLAKNAKEYYPIFSAETQRKIDDTASAFNRLGASLKSVFGEVIATFGLDEKLNNLSDWLRDNKQNIVQFFDDLTTKIGNLGREVGATLKDFQRLVFALTHPVDAAKMQFGGGATFDPAMYGGSGPGSFNPATVQRILDEQSRRGVAVLDRTGLEGPVFGPSGFGLNYDVPLPPGFGAESRPSSRPSFPSALGGPDPLALVTVLPAVEAHLKATAEATAKVAKAQEIAGVSTKQLTDELTKQSAVIEDAIISVDEYADLFAGNFTDAFLDAIEGTKTFARAFGDMTISIIRDIGRLLVFRSIFGLVAGALTSPGTLTDPTSQGSGGFLTPDFDFPQIARAGGGSMTRAGIVSVNEQGRERVFLPRGARVEPAHFRGGSSGLTVNVIGARDARATATEVIAELRRNGALRAAVRLA